MSWRFEGDLSPFRIFLRRVREVLGGAINRDAARQTAADINRQKQAAWQFIFNFYPPEPGGRPLKRRYDWGDGQLHKFPSLKAQRYFFGVVLKGGNFPYERTGTLRRSLSATIEEVSPRGYLIRFVSDSRIAPYNLYVIGARQNLYHKDTGWPLLVALPSQALAENPSVLADTYLDLLAGYVAGRAD
jgi:hypothetical protein